MRCLVDLNALSVIKFCLTVANQAIMSLLRNQHEKSFAFLNRALKEIPVSGHSDPSVICKNEFNFAPLIVEFAVFCTKA